MNRIMIDIETLSLDPRALILSIGAVDFTGDVLGKEFYANINAYEQPQRHVSASTALWWIKQAMTNPLAAAALFEGEHVTLVTALTQLSYFLADYPDCEVWFNGPQFDAVALESACADENVRLSWKYNAVRDCRTLFKLAESMGWGSESVDHTKFTAHNALADAKLQALRTISALGYLGID